MRELSGPPIKSTIHTLMYTPSAHQVVAALSHTLLHQNERERGRKKNHTNPRKPYLIEVNVTNSNLHIGATLQSILSHLG